jgi:hypothetical protein
VYELSIISPEYPSLNTEKFGVGVVTWGNLKPVTLTEERLVKFGFKHEQNNSTHNYRRANLEGLYLDYWVLSRHDPASWYRLIHEIGKIIVADKIWHAHQLQNLYFDLKGEELKTK